MPLRHGLLLRAVVVLLALIESYLELVVVVTQLLDALGGQLEAVPQLIVQSPRIVELGHDATVQLLQVAVFALEILNAVDNIVLDFGVPLEAAAVVLCVEAENADAAVAYTGRRLFGSTCCAVAGNPWQNRCALQWQCVLCSTICAVVMR